LRENHPPQLCQTPISAKSPGIRSVKAVQHQFSRFSKRFVPIIVTPQEANLCLAHEGARSNDINFNEPLLMS